jgi:hypothetical protein
MILHPIDIAAMARVEGHVVPVDVPSPGRVRVAVASFLRAIARRIEGRPRQPFEFVE